jgi:hypothetical protein
MPDTFIAVRSAARLVLQNRGDELHFETSAASLIGLCGVDGPLSNDDAVTAELLFPSELSGTYDQSTCMFLPIR